MDFKIYSLNKLKETLLILVIIGLIILPFFYIRTAWEVSSLYYGVKFPNGESSFADEVISYDPVIYRNEQGLPNVAPPFNNPGTALGIPNSSSPKNPQLSAEKRNDVALGLGGSITLYFKDNLLTGSGDQKLDLWIFEAGEKRESVEVEISKDGITWYKVGQTHEQSRGIDIDAFGWGINDFFPYIRLTDNPLEGEHDGYWKNGQWIGSGGADIDAVGAISSVYLVPSSHSSLSFSFLAQFTLFILLLLGVFFGFYDFFQNRKLY